MKTLLRHILVLFVICLLSTATVVGQTTLNGEIGIDLQNFIVKKELTDTVWTYSVNRSRSGHFVNASITGPIVNNQFANYSARFGLIGAYFDSKTDVESNHEYVKPNIGSYYTQMTLLPNKPFPLQIYRSNIDNYTLRLEPNNIGEREIPQPELGIVRRYRLQTTSTGGQWQVKPKENVKLITEVRHDISDSRRIYDFNEDNDIWVTTIESQGRLGDSIFTAVISNSTDDSLSITLLNLDSLENGGDPHTVVITDIQPGRIIIIDSVYMGRNEFQFDGRNLNRYRKIVDVDAHLRFDVTKTDPATPNDIKQSIDMFTGILSIGDEGPFSNETFYEYSDMRESFQKQTTFMNSLANTAHYQFNKKFAIDGLTTYQNNHTTIDTTSDQSNSMFRHQTSLNYQKRRGMSGTFEHAYGSTVSDVKLDATTNSVIKSDLHNIDSRLLFPFRKYEHRVEVRGNISLLSDNNDLVNNQYTATIANSMEILKWGMKLRPKHELKLSHKKQENPDQLSNELETKFALYNDLPKSKIFGNIKIRTEYNYRKRDDLAGSDIRSRYLSDISLIRKFGKKYRLSLQTSQEYDTYGGSTPTSGEQKEPEYKASYRIDLQAAPSSKFALGGNFMLITQGTTKIQRYGFSVLFEIPGLDLPVKSFLIGELRDLEGVPRQTQLSIDTKASYQIRKISLIFTHRYSREKQIYEIYSFNELQAKVVRQFNVF